MLGIQEMVRDSGKFFCLVGRSAFSILKHETLNLDGKLCIQDTSVRRLDIKAAACKLNKQTSEFISACNCSIRHEHQREGGNGIPLVLVPFFFFQ